MNQIICSILVAVACATGCGEERFEHQFNAEVDSCVEDLRADGVVAEEDRSGLRNYIKSAYSLEELRRMSVSDIDSSQIDGSKFSRLVKNLCLMGARVYLCKGQGEEFKYHALFNEENSFEIDWIISLVVDEVDLGELNLVRRKQLGWIEGDQVFYFSNQDNLEGWVVFRQGRYVHDFRVVGGRAEDQNPQANHNQNFTGQPIARHGSMLAVYYLSKSRFGQLLGYESLRRRESASNTKIVSRILVCILVATGFQDFLMAEAKESALSVSVDVEELVYTIVIENQLNEKVKIPDPFFSPLSNGEVPVGAYVQIDDVQKADGAFLFGSEGKPFSSLSMVSDTYKSRRRWIAIPPMGKLERSYQVEDLWRGMVIKSVGDLRNADVGFRFKIGIKLSLDQSSKASISSESNWCSF